MIYSFDVLGFPSWDNQNTHQKLIFYLNDKVTKPRYYKGYYEKSMGLPKEGSLVVLNCEHSKKEIAKSQMIFQRLTENKVYILLIIIH